MDRADLLPSENCLERLFLLDILGQNSRAVPDGLDVDAFLAITPENLYAFVHASLLNVPNAPRALLDRTGSHYRRNVMLMLQRSADLRRLDATLSDARIPYLVLKGPILANTVYPDPATRTMLDLDLLVREGDLERAIAALSAIGYQVPERFAGVAMNPGDAPPMIDPVLGSAPLELHALLESIPQDDPALEAAWAGARRVATRHGVALPCLDRGELFAHVVMHASRQSRFAGGLRTLVDVSMLLREEATKLDWRALDAEWQRRGIAGWIALTIELAYILLGAPVPDVYKDRHSSPEAISLAVEQLMLTERTVVPVRLTQAIARRVPLATHHGVRRIAPAPTGLRYRVRHEWTRVQRVLSALGNGGLRPRNVARSVDLFLKRERLVALLENERPPR